MNGFSGQIMINGPEQALYRRSLACFYIICVMLQIKSSFIEELQQLQLQQSQIMINGPEQVQQCHKYFVIFANFEVKYKIIFCQITVFLWMAQAVDWLFLNCAFAFLAYLYVQKKFTKEICLWKTGCMQCNPPFSTHILKSWGNGHVCR